MKDLLKKLEFRFRRYAVSNLMNYIVGGMAIVFVFSLFTASRGISLYSAMSFDRNAIAAGQVWRIISFVFLPPSQSPIWIIFSLYFYWLMGSALERDWGAFRFNLFYFIGIIGNIIAGLITGGATNQYLNLSLFLAAAILYPDERILLFFFIPVKFKWLAAADAVLIGLAFFTGSLSVKAAIIMSLINLALFFGGDLIDKMKILKNKIVYRFRSRGGK